ncbi:MAG: insulinase family protein [Elusimicrobiota bacterium]|nr:MAG: insulinase family protein [Elusimicrobiota bacterium]
MKILAPLALAVLLAAPASAKPKAPAWSAPSVPAVQETPRADDAMGVSIHRLGNGLTVYLSPNKGEPRISVRVAVRAGSKNDPADSTGMAHYLEHMLFKGTGRLGTLDYEKERGHLEKIRSLYEDLFKTKDEAARAKIYKEIDAENGKAAAFAVPNEFDRFYRSIGAEGLNAYTSDEETVYVVSIPANRLEAWARVEAERFKSPVFRLFQSEIETVYEEKNRSMDNAERILHDEVENRLYKQHPYGQQPTLGSVEHLKNPSLAKMYAFYDLWYAPNNMAIVLAGDFDRAKALELVKRHFGAWTPRPLTQLPKWELPRPKAGEKYEVKYEAEQKVELAWLTVPSGHADADALEVMDMILDNSAAGLLNLRLNQAQKVKASGSYPSMRNDAGSWHAWALPKKGQTPEEAEKLLLEVVDAVKAGDFTEDDVAAVITNFEMGEKGRLESNDARAGLMASSFVSLEPWERSVGRLDRMRKITKADVVRVASKYLGAERIVVYRRDAKPEIPKIVKPSFTKIAIDPSRESSFMKEILAIPAPPLDPRWLAAGKDYQITPIGGGRLYSAKNPYNDLFALSFLFERGSRVERELCSALDLLDLAGAGPYSADEFKKKLFALGTSLSYSCGEQESGIHLSGLDRNMWPSLELMAQRFDWPNIEAGTLAKMIEVELGAREDEKKNPGAVHGALGQVATRGRDSAVLKRLSNSELKALNEGRLKSLIRDFLHYPARVAYIGNREPREVGKLLDSGRRLKPVAPRVPLKLLRPSTSRVLFTHRDMVQAQVGLFAADETFDPEHVIDYLYYAEYMGGDMSAVIFQEVREARSLAYSASGGHTTSAEKGDDTQLWGRLGCQADKTPEAVKLMTSLFRDFPGAEKRFRETSRSIEESYRTSPVPFRSIPGAVIGWEDQGLSGDPRPKRFERALKYTLPELQTFAERFKTKPLTVWILGHRDRVGLDELKTLGEFEEKPLDSLFPY